YSSTGCWVKIPFVDARAKINILLNYGNPSANIQSNPDSVFDFYDDFDSGVIDDNKWLRTGGSKIVNGYLQPVVENMVWGGMNYIYSKKNFSYLSNRGVIECQVRSRQNSAGGNVIFFVDDPYASSHYLLQHETRYLGNSDGDFGYRSAGAAGELSPPLVYQWNKDEECYYYILISSNSNFYHNRYSVTNSGRQISGSVIGSYNMNWHYIGFSAISVFTPSFEVNWVRVRKWTPREPAVRTTNTGVLKTTPYPVDFGWLVCEKDSTQTISLINYGDAVINITRIHFLNVKNSVFMLPPVDTMNLQANESRDLSIIFNPKFSGKYFDTLVIENSNPCIPPAIIPFSGMKDTINIQLAGVANDTIDFGVLCQQSLRDTLFSVMNISSVPTTISSSTFNPPFSYAGKNPFYKQFDLNETRDVRLIFDGSNRSPGIYLDSIIIKDTCNNSIFVFLKSIIAQPDFTFVKDTIDFGESMLPCDSIKTDTIKIMNNSAFGIKGVLKNFEIGGIFNSPDIAKIDLIKNDILPDSSVKSYLITFTPKQSRDYDDSIKITFDPCGIEKSIYLKGTAKEASFHAQRDGIDLGSVILNQFKDTLVFFKNTGTTDLQLQNIFGINPPYQLLQSQPSIPGVLQPGDSLTIYLRFFTTDTLLHFTTIQVTGQPCDISDSVPIKAKGLPIVAKTLIYIPNTHCKTGEKITIPLVLESSANLIQSGIDAFSAKIQMNKTILKPTNVPDDSISINGQTREIRISGLWNRPDGILYNFDFVSTLGDSECTDINISDFKWLNGLSNVDMISGRFCLTDVCKEGGERLFNSDGKISFEQCKPNPATDNTVIDFEVIEKARTQIYIMDILGRKVGTIFDKFTDPGKYTIQFDVSSIENGLYILVLQTPTSLLQRFMGVMK
ncbi:MAG: DUF2341 domain-containing protein, partial [FCB group bacterium]